MNYPTLPRSGLLAPRLLRVGSSERPSISRDHERRVVPFERLPVSVSELASGVDTAVPDSAGDFPLQVVRSVPLLPVGHSATTDDARFLSSFERASLSRDVARIRRILAASGKSPISRNDERRVASFEPRLNTAGGVVSIVLPRTTTGVVNVVENVSANRAALYPLPTRSLRSLLEEGGLAPQHS